MSLHPQVKAILAERSASADLPLDEARVVYEQWILRHAGPSEEVASVSDVEHGRLYVPADAVGAVLFIHGGGWVMGTVDAYDPLCRALANRSGAAVLSVDYRLAPEAQFPAALEDCEAALAWLAERYEPLAVAGESSGANLAAVLARRVRGLRFQLLFYPPTDAACATASMLDLGTGDYGLTRAEMLDCWAEYAPGASARSPDASPLRAADLGGLPPAFVVAAELDPLRDDATDYAERMRAAGVEVRTAVYEGMVHGFVRFGAVEAAREALDEAGAELRAALLK